MNMQEDIRWKQRFDNFQRALRQLRHAVELSESRALSDLEKQGMIQAFEYTHELAWNTLKDFLKEKGATQPLYGSKDTTRLAFSQGLIENGEEWMNMISSRNQTSHTYNQEVAEKMTARILSVYFPAFQELEARMKSED